MSLVSRWLVVGAVSLGAAGLAVVGCSSSDSSSPGTSTSSSGGSSSGGSSSGGSSSGGSSSGSSEAGADTLYDRLGKKDGIAKALDAIVTAELADSDIASYFVVVGKAGHAPSPDAIKECLVNQLGAAAGGPDTEVKYPTMTSGGFQCRDMKTAHAGLGIPAGTFDNFVTIAAGELKKLGVADADIATIGGVLNGTKTDIVTDTTRDAGPFEGDAGQ